MKKLFLVIFVLVAAFACSDESAPATHSTLFQYITLNENSETITVNNPVGNTTTFTKDFTFAVQKEKLKKVTVNSIRLDIDQYDVSPSEIWGVVTFKSETGVGNAIAIPLKEDYITILSNPTIAERIERDLELKGYVNVSFHVSIPPENTTFTIKAVIAMDISQESQKLEIAMRD